MAAGSGGGAGNRWTKFVEMLKLKTSDTDVTRRRNSDKNVLQRVLSEYSSRRSLTVPAGSVAFLQHEIDQYEVDIEKRRQRLLDSAQTTVAAVVGAKKAAAAGKLREGDDSLPYEPKHLNWNSISKRVRKTTATSPSSGPSSATDSSSSSVSEDSNQLTGVLMSIINETQEESKKKDEASDWSTVELVTLSSDNIEKFDWWTNQNTKDALFLTQPTKHEIKLFNSGKARTVPSCQYKLDFSEAVVETEKFCVGCAPRHAGYPFFKEDRQFTIG